MQLPSSAQAAEATPLRKRLGALRSGRARDPQGLASILPKVLARLGTEPVESKQSGAPGPREPRGADGPRTPSRPVGSTLYESLALSRVTNAGYGSVGPTPDEPVWRDGAIGTREKRP
jgi:hypothetical protein